MFDSPEELRLFEPGTLLVAPQVADQLPDAGDYFLDWCTRALDDEQAREVESAVNGRRCANGWFPLESLDSIGQRGFWRGPLSYLAQMTADDSAILQGWAARGVEGEDRQRIQAIVNDLLHEQGHAAAATWALAVRPQAGLDPAEVGDRLVAAWDRNLNAVRTKDVAKSVRRWNR